MCVMSSTTTNHRKGLALRWLPLIAMLGVVGATKVRLRFHLAAIAGVKTVGPSLCFTGLSWRSKKPRLAGSLVQYDSIHSKGAQSHLSTQRLAVDEPMDPLIVCGPSGVGKGTIINEYMAKMGGDQHFGFTVSHTTRSPRPNELGGIHYHFVSSSEMEALLGTGEPMNDPFFLEYAHVHGNWYGTSWQAIRKVQDSGKRALLDIDVQGVKRIRSLTETSGHRTDLDKFQNHLGQPLPSPLNHARTAASFSPRFLFITPPSIHILEHRLRTRNTESEASLQRRLGNAASEIEYGTAASSNFDAVIVNDTLEQACRDFALAVARLYNL
jgi:guanylate kinase